MPPDQPRLGRLAEFFLASAGYGLLAYLLASPLFDLPHRTLVDSGSVASWVLSANTDVFIWALSWDWHALTTQPWSFWDANILSPTASSLAAVFPRLGHLPIFGPLLAISDNAVAAHQLNLLANFALSGGASYALLREWGVRPANAFFAGFVYAFCPARISSVATPSLVAGQYLPLGLLFLERAARSATWKNILLATLFFVWQALCALPFVYLVPPILLTYWIFASLMRRPGYKTWPILAATALTTSAIALSLAPTVLAVSRGTLEAPAGASEIGFFDLGAVQSWADYIDRAKSLRGRGQADQVAAPVYIGWAPMALAALAIASTARRRAWNAGALLSCALAAIVLSFGPKGFASTGVWQLLANLTPKTTPILLPSHLGLLFAMVAAVFAGLGLDKATELLPGNRTRRALTLALLLVTAWDLRLIGERQRIEVVPRSPYEPRIYSLLRQRPAGSLLELPYDNCRLDATIAQARTMFDSTFHWRPIINGLGELRPTHQREIQSLVDTLPDPRALRLLARIADLRHVISHVSAMPVADRYAWMELDSIEEIAFADGRFLVEVTGPSAPSLTERFRRLEEQETTLLGTPVGPLPELSRVMDVSAHFEGPVSLPSIPIRASATIRNSSDRTWPVLGGGEKDRVRIAYFWEDESGARLAKNDEHALLPFDLGPGESVSLSFCVVPPAVPGRLQLRVGVVQDDRWFRGEPARAPIDLRPYQAATTP